MRAATGTKTSRLFGRTVRIVPDPSQRRTAGTPAPVWTMTSCQTLARPRTTRLMPRVMISGWTRNTPTPTPVRKPGEGRDERARRAGRRARPWAADERRDDEPAHRGDGTDGEVDAAGQERQRLARGEERERDRRPAG